MKTLSKVANGAARILCTFAIALMGAGASLMHPEEAHAAVPTYVFGQTPIPEPYANGWCSPSSNEATYSGFVKRWYGSGEWWNKYTNTAKRSDVWQFYPRSACMGDQLLDVKVYIWASAPFSVSERQCSMWFWDAAVASLHAEIHFFKTGTNVEVSYTGGMYVNMINTAKTVGVSGTAGVWRTSDTTVLVNADGSVTGGAWSNDPYDKKFCAWLAVSSSPSSPLHLIMNSHSSSSPTGTAIYGDCNYIDYRIASKSELRPNSAVTTIQNYAGGAYTVRDPHQEQAGYTFSGWYADEGCTQKVTRYPMLTSNVTLYGYYTANPYTVRYNANGADGSPASQAVRYDKAFNIQKNAYGRDGYTFLSWNTDPNGKGESYSEGKQVKNLASKADAIVDLYAIWEPDPYQVIIHPNGADDDQGPGWSETDAEYIVPEPEITRTGYTFAHWVDDEGNIRTPGETVTNLPVEGEDQRTLTAEWDPIAYRIAYDANGGSGNMDATSCIYDEAVELPSCAFTLTGHTFQGWGISPDGPVIYEDHAMTINMSKEADATITLYATWNEDAEVRITYMASDPEHASLTREHEDVAPASGEAKGCTVTPARGYVFEGWTDRNGDQVTDTAKLEPARGEDGLWHAQELIAQIRPAEYQVSFDANDGEGAPGPISTEYDEQVILPLDAPSYGTRAFLGWSMEPDGPVAYQPGDAIKNLTEEDGAEITLHAVWGPEIFQVTYEDGLGNTLKTDEVESGGSSTPPEDPERYGWTFLGWSEPSDAVAQDMRITATWEQIFHHVIWKDGMNAVIAEADVPHGESATPPEDPSRKGLVFMGWDADTSCIEMDSIVNARWAGTAAAVLPDAATPLSKGLPQTGDALGLALMALTLLGSAAAGGAFALRKKMRASKYLDNNECHE